MLKELNENVKKRKENFVKKRKMRMLEELNKNSKKEMEHFRVQM